MYMKKHIKGGASEEEDIEFEDFDTAEGTGPYIPLAQGDVEEVSGVVEEGQPVEEEVSGLLSGTTPLPQEVGTVFSTPKEMTPRVPTPRVPTPREATPPRVPTPVQSYVLKRTPTTSSQLRESLYVPSGQTDIPSAQMYKVSPVPVLENEKEQFLVYEGLQTFTGEEKLSEEIRTTLNDLRQSLFNIHNMIKTQKTEGIAKLEEFLPMLQKINNDLNGRKINTTAYRSFVKSLNNHISHLERLYKLNREEGIPIDTISGSDISSREKIRVPMAEPMMEDELIFSTPPMVQPTQQPITTDDRKAIIAIARLYVEPIKIDGRTPSRSNDELYNFGLNIFDHNKSLAQTIDQFICLRPEQIIYKNTKTKKTNRLYTTNNRTVKKHLEEVHGLRLKSKTDLKENLLPLQAQKCAIPPVDPQIDVQMPLPIQQAPVDVMHIAPVIPPVNVDVAGLKRSILSGIGELLDRLITNETMRGGRYRRNKRGTVRSYRNKRRVSRKHRKASKGRKTRRS